MGGRSRRVTRTLEDGDSLLSPVRLKTGDKKSCPSHRMAGSQPNPINDRFGTGCVGWGSREERGRSYTTQQSASQEREALKQTALVLGSRPPLSPAGAECRAAASGRGKRLQGLLSDCSAGCTWGTAPHSNAVHHDTSPRETRQDVSTTHAPRPYTSSKGSMSSET
ncbi:hypothetical protein EYF80_013079 [Liparis tanakae]|uniref:Uncharacterized protein n=1 Tax=Liparis tanakae TaxID=230148 RepID=A0A4Z2IFL7_9TELE|nr:hypothetical protein EYF80_013079 [Liparis tanakae]